MKFDKNEIRSKIRTDNLESKLQEVEKRKQITATLGLPVEFRSKEDIPFIPVLVSGDVAIYISPGDDISVMDVRTKEMMEENAGYEKYAETMRNVINHGQEFEFGERFAYFCSNKEYFAPQKEPEVLKVDAEETQEIDAPKRRKGLTR